MKDDIVVFHFSFFVTVGLLSPTRTQLGISSNGILSVGGLQPCSNCSLTLGMPVGFSILSGCSFFILHATVLGTVVYGKATQAQPRHPWMNRIVGPFPSRPNGITGTLLLLPITCLPVVFALVSCNSSALHLSSLNQVLRLEEPNNVVALCESRKDQHRDLDHRPPHTGRVHRQCLVMELRFAVL